MVPKLSISFRQPDKSSEALQFSVRFAEMYRPLDLARSLENFSAVHRKAVIRVCDSAS